MNSGSIDQLEQLQKEVVQGQFQEVTKAIHQKLHEEGGSCSEKLRYQLLKSHILYLQGYKEEARKIAEEIMEEGTTLNEPLLIIDAIIAFLFVVEYERSYKDCEGLLHRATTLLEQLKGQLTSRDFLKRKGHFLFIKGNLSFDKNGDIVRSIDHLEQGMEIFAEIGDTVNQSRICLSLAEKYGWKGDGKVARRWAEKSLKIAQTNEDKLTESSVLISLGEHFLVIGELDKSLECYQESLTLREQLGVKKRYYLPLRQIGMVLALKGEKDKALSYHLRHLLLAEEEGFREQKFHSLFALLDFYYYYEDEGKSSEYLNKVLRYAEELKNEQLLSEVYIYQANIKVGNGEIDQGLESLEKAHTLIQKSNNTLRLVDLYINIAYVQFLRGEPDEASHYLRKCLTLSQKIGYQLGQLNALRRMGYYYQIAKNDFKTARKYYKEALEINRDIEYIFRRDEIFILYQLVKIYSHQGQPEKVPNILIRMEEICQKLRIYPCPSILKLVKAIYLKSSERLQDKFEAQKLLATLARDTILGKTFSLISLDIKLNLCDLLIYELTLTGNEAALAEVKDVTTELLKVSETQRIHPLQIELLVIQSKIALLELKIPEAQTLLDQALEMARERNLQNLSERLNQEKEQLYSQLTKWSSFIDQHTSMKGRIELTQIDQLFGKLVQHQSSEVEMELLKYTMKAREFVDDWNRRKSAGE